ncbi:MAG: rod-binding protein [Syntrophorhabdaceae bacterium]|nr:rod-binding protein [Syntrophorhabdaceae bacterium]
MSDGIKTGAMINLQNPPASFYTSRILKNHGQKDESNIEKVAQDFESFLIYTMLKEMEKTVSSSGKSFMKQTYMSVMYEKLGDYIAKKGIGIKDMVAEHMKKNIKVLKEMGDNNGK